MNKKGIPKLELGNLSQKNPNANEIHSGMLTNNMKSSNRNTKHIENMNSSAGKRPKTERNRKNEQNGNNGGQVYNNYFKKGIKCSNKDNLCLNKKSCMGSPRNTTQKNSTINNYIRTI